MSLSNIVGELTSGCPSIEASRARQSFREIIDGAAAGGRRIVITRHGRPVAALVAVRDLATLRENDLETDRKMIRSRPKPGRSIPLDEFLSADEKNQAESSLSSTEVPAEQFAEGVALQFAEEYMKSAVYKDVLRELRHHLPDSKGVKLAEMPDLRRHLLAWLWNSVQQVGVGA